MASILSRWDYILHGRLFYNGDSFEEVLAVVRRAGIDYRPDVAYSRSQLWPIEFLAAGVDVSPGQRGQYDAFVRVEFTKPGERDCVAYLVRRNNSVP